MSNDNTVVEGAFPHRHLLDTDVEAYETLAARFGVWMMDRLIRYHDRGAPSDWADMDENWLVQAAYENVDRAYRLMVNDRVFEQSEKTSEDMRDHTARILDQIADVANLMNIAFAAHVGRLNAEALGEEPDNDGLPDEFGVDRMVNEGGHDA